MAVQLSKMLPTVLLVEDAYDDRQMYAEYLRLCHVHAIEIANTADDLALAPTTDIVVTGIRVGGPFDGLELVRRLRADDKTKRTPVIVLTACVMESERERAYAAGCDVFLPKPCMPEMLLHEIRLRLPTHRRARS